MEVYSWENNYHMGLIGIYLPETNKKLLKMAIEIVDLASYKMVMFRSYIIVISFHYIIVIIVIS